MKRILAILVSCVFLVASVPGSAFQQLLDPAAMSELVAGTEQQNNSEEKQEAHFTVYRHKLQAVTPSQKPPQAGNAAHLRAFADPRLALAKGFSSTHQLLLRHLYLEQNSILI